MNKNRKDGIYIKPEDSIHAIMPYLFHKRTEAEVYINTTFDITVLKEYLNKQDIPYFHGFLTAIAKTIYHRPLLNRFIAGRRIYKRNDLTISFVAKNKFEDNAEERLHVLTIKDDMSLTKISKIINEKVTKTRQEGTNNMNDTLSFITKFPRFITRIIVGFFKWLDYHGWVPTSITNGDPNYTSVLVSNLGSIKAPSCYHHLNDYGTNSVVATIGTIYSENSIDDKGNIVTKDKINIAFTLDERIADGFYFAKSIKLFEYLINNPIILEEKISEEFDYES